MAPFSSPSYANVTAGFSSLSRVSYQEAIKTTAGVEIMPSNQYLAHPPGSLAPPLTCWVTLDQDLISLGFSLLREVLIRGRFTVLGLGGAQKVQGMTPLVSFRRG